MRNSNGRVPVVLVLCLIIALGLVLAGPAFAEKVIKNVKVIDFDDRVEVTVTSNQSPYFNPRPSVHGDYICFAFSGRCALSGKLVPIKNGRVYSVRYGNYSSNPPTTRVVINTGKSLNYSTTWSADKHSVTISVWKNGSKPSTAKETVQPEVKPVEPVIESASNEPTMAEPKPVPAIRNASITLPPAAPFVRRVVEQKGSDSGSDQARAAMPSFSQPLLDEPVRIAKVSSGKAPDVRNISLDFIAADINDVLKALSVQSGANIVSGADVKGNITVSLSKISLQEALDYVAKLSGYKYARDGDTYVVGSAQGVGSIVGGEAVGTDVASEAILVRFSNIKALNEVLARQFPELRLSADGGEEDKRVGPKLFALVGPAPVVQQARALVEKIESAFEKENNGRSVEIYEAKYASPKELVGVLKDIMPQVFVTLSAPDGFNDKAPGPVSIDGNEGGTVQAGSKALPADAAKSQKIIVAGAQEDVKRAIDLLIQTDIKLPQILIEAKVTDISVTGEKQLGINWSWDEGQWLETAYGVPDVASEGSLIPIGNKSWLRMPLNFKARLDAAFKNGNAKLLASPHITSIEGKPAVFFVGDEIKYVTNIQSTSNGVTIATDTAKVGIQLRVVADVSPTKDITLNIHPEVSAITDWIRANVGGSGTDTANQGVMLPQIARRFTDQTIRVKDGESIVIGGLIKETELSNMTKVPLLGDLPFFGNLFRHREKSREKSEIVVFLKATVVE